MKEPTLQLGGSVYELPESIRPLGHDNMYVVPLDLVRPADKEDKEREGYHWVNPRHYEANSSEGFGKDDMDSLLKDIRDDGLIYAIVCRWTVLDGEIHVEILDGERRWRCISQLVREGQECFDKESGKWLPASEVYPSVPCKVYLADDKESLKIAYMATDRQVGWGDGAKVRLIKRLRSAGCGDEEILDLTKKSGQWLREEDKLCALDDHTFAYYSGGKLNRAVALRLADIPDLQRRHKWLEATYEDAQEADARRLKKLDEDIARCEEKEEIAEAQLAEVQVRGDPEQIEVAEQHLSQSQEKTNGKKRQKARGAQAKTKHLRAAVTRMSEGATDAPPEPPPESVVQPLRAGAIKKQLEVLEGLLEKDGCEEGGEEVAPPEALGYVIACYRAILNGEENIERVMKRQTKVRKLTEERQRR